MFGAAAAAAAPSPPPSPPPPPPRAPASLLSSSPVCGGHVAVRRVYSEWFRGPRVIRRTPSLEIPPRRCGTPCGRARRAPPRRRPTRRRASGSASRIACGSACARHTREGGARRRSRCEVGEREAPAPYAPNCSSWRLREATIPCAPRAAIFPRPHLDEVRDDGVRDCDAVECRRTAAELRRVAEEE